MVNRVVENPNTFQVENEIEEFGRREDLTFEVEERRSEKLVVTSPNGGKAELYIDRMGADGDDGKEDGSYLRLSHDDYQEEYKVRELTRVEFDYRPDDNQYRIIISATSGYSDFGL